MDSNSKLHKRNFIGFADQRTAALLYNGVYVFIAIIFNLLWRYAVSRNHHLLGKEVDKENVGRISKQYAFGPLLYLFCAALAWISVPASLGGKCSPGYVLRSSTIARKQDRERRRNGIGE